MNVNAKNMTDSENQEASGGARNAVVAVSPSGSGVRCKIIVSRCKFQGRRIAGRPNSMIPVFALAMNNSQ
jgi:hypothetical protein